MTSRRAFMLGSASLGGAGLIAAGPVLAKQARSGPPFTRTAPVSDFYYGEQVIDRYRWMETNPQTPEFKAWLKAQGDFSRKALDALPKRKAVAGTLKTYSAELPRAWIEDVTPTHLIIARREPGHDGVLHYKRPKDGGLETLLIDPDTIKLNGKLRNVTAVMPSPDGQKLLYCLDTNGDEISHIYMLDMVTLKSTQVTDMDSGPNGWLPDGSGFFYSRIRPGAVVGATDYAAGMSVWRHNLGTDVSADVKVFEAGEAFIEKAEYDADIPVVLTAAGSDYIIAWHRVIAGPYPSFAYIAKLSELSLGKTPWKPFLTLADNAHQIALVGSDIYVLVAGNSGNGEIFKVSGNGS